MFFGKGSSVLIPGFDSFLLRDANSTVSRLKWGTVTVLPMNLCGSWRTPPGLRSSCVIKKSAFNVAGNLVMVVKFTFQAVFGNSRRNPRHLSARSHLSCILSFDGTGQHQNKRFYVITEIVLSLGFAGAIFRRERSDDRKCVCCWQAIYICTHHPGMWIINGPFLVLFYVWL